MTQKDRDIKLKEIKQFLEDNLNIKSYWKMLFSQKMRKVQQSSYWKH